MPYFSSLLDLLATSRAILGPLPGRVTTEKRLRAFPQTGLPLRCPAKIYWNHHQIPFIDAQTDEDAAFLLGMVHAHLRLGQLEIYRRAVVGRLAEIAGPPAIALDWTLRLLGLDHAVPEIERRLPETTRTWLSHFVSGINYYRSRAKRVPFEVKALGMKNEPWSLLDLLRISRLAAADVSWFTFFGYFSLRSERGFDSFWDRYQQVKMHAASGTGLWGDAGSLAKFLNCSSRTGSNCWAVSAERSRSAAPLLAGDPHLGLSLPNLWLTAGYRCPSYHVVGFMLPGVPFVALGRNADLAWGGTNLHAQSSDLYDVSHLPDSSPEITSERQNVGVRWWRSREITLRRTPWGPLISDSPLFTSRRPGEKIALRWVGHEPSDEITSMLRANRARTADEFSSSFADYAVSGQNFLVADRHGKMAHVVAAKIPRREELKEQAIVLDSRAPGAQWKGYWTSCDFDLGDGTREGFIASANNRPRPGNPSVGRSFPPTDRVDRISELLRARRDWDLPLLCQIQSDTYSRSTEHLRDLFVAHLRERKPTPVWLSVLAAWDCHYRREAQEPVIFQTLLVQYVRLAYGLRFTRKLRRFLLGSEMSRLFVTEDLGSKIPATLGALYEAADCTTRRLKAGVTWGDRHRLRLGHWFQNIPVVGRKFKFFDFPADGSSETVRKTAHAVREGKHGVHYGSQARHLSDLGDPDANFFLLLGGQDGWLGSENFSDQVDLWERNELIAFPFKIESIAKAFPLRMDLKTE